MKKFKIIAVIVGYLVASVLEIISFHLFKADCFEVFAFFTVIGFVITFEIVLNDS